MDEMECYYCKVGLVELYIQCVPCEIRICVNCFANGRESDGGHRNNHDYRIFRDDNICVFGWDPAWSAREERQLLDSVERFGCSDWESVGTAMNKSPEECREHYYSKYVSGTPSHGDKFKCRPLRWRTEQSDPLRLNPDSKYFKNTAGYRFARSDFDYPYDPSAECIFNGINLDQDAFWDEFSAVLFQCYNRRLRYWGFYFKRKWPEF